MPSIPSGKVGNLFFAESGHRPDWIKFDVYQKPWVDDQGDTYVFSWKYVGTYCLDCWVEVGDEVVTVPEKHQWRCTPGFSIVKDPTQEIPEGELAAFIEYANWD